MSTFGQDQNKSGGSPQTDASQAKVIDKPVEQAKDTATVVAKDKPIEEVTNLERLAGETDEQHQARIDALSPEKDLPTDDDSKPQTMDDSMEIPADDPNKPAAILDESPSEKKDRHEASLEMGVGEVTDPETQGDSSLAEDASVLIIPGAATGPDNAGVVRNDHGKVAYAPAGTLNAAMNGVQEDASGHVSSIHTDNSSQSGTRV